MMLQLQDRASLVDDPLISEVEAPARGILAA
jgi:hypothetical protein